MKSGYSKILFIILSVFIVLIFIWIGLGRRVSWRIPSIDSELNSLDQDLRDVDSIPSDVEVPAEPSGSSNPVNEFKSLLNSVGNGINDVEAVPTDVQGE